MDDFRAELQGCYGSIAYKRNAQSIPGAPTVGREARQRRLTEELDDWLNSDFQPRLTLEEARALAYKEQGRGRGVDEIAFGEAVDATVRDDDD